MAAKLVTLKRKNGDLYYPKTTLSQVIGLSTELAGKQPSLTAEQLDAVNSGATVALVGKITTNETAIGGIEAKIPAQANTENQLADKDFVNSSINAMAADFVAYDANNANFPTKAALLTSKKWYHSGAEFIPQKNDYLVVLADESEGGKQTRYLVVNDFKANTAPTTTDIQLQYVINDAPFTAAQNASISSGITASKVAQYDGLVDDMGNYLAKNDAANTYVTKEEVEGLGTVCIVPNGADLSGCGDEDLIIELDEE